MMSVPLRDREAMDRLLPVLNQDSTPKLRTSRPILTWHTMVGSLNGSEAEFRSGRRPGVGSHWGLGGPWDGTSSDGELRQWIRLDRQSGAQWDGNPYCLSVECSDGGDPNRPLSEKQIIIAVKLTVRWAGWVNTPTVRIAENSADYGTTAWHRLFPSWNKSNHSCPGDVRQAQIIGLIIPTANSILHGKPEGLGMTKEEYIAAEIELHDKHADDVTYGILRAMRHPEVRSLISEAVKDGITAAIPAPPAVK